MAREPWYGSWSSRCVVPDGSERHGTLEHPANRQRLIAALVTGERTRTELASEYGVTQQAVSAFAARHSVRIAQMAEEHAYQWASRQAGQLQALDRLMADVIAVARWDGEVATKLRSMQVVMRQVADELEQRPDRILITQGGVPTIPANAVP